MYNREQAADLKNQINVKDFYKKFLKQLEDSNASNLYVGLCPFHNDHSPSLKIDKESGVWRCWVDGIGGDMIDFVERFFGYNYIQAMEYIIKEFDIKIEVSEKAKKEYVLRKTMTKLHENVSMFYQKALPQNKTAIEYLKSRYFDADTIRKFRIGFIPEDNICSNEKLRPLFYTSGLTWKDGNNFFTPNRISFPYQDMYGNIVGFNARTIVNDKPKYLHSKTTHIFKKDELLYGFYQARESIIETKSVFLVEGNVDCIRAHQFGLTNTIALSGTVIHDKQINQLKSICKNYYIILEDDVMERISKNSKDSPLDKMYNTIMSNNPYANVKIVKLYQGSEKCDLDEFLLRYKKSSFLLKVKESKTYNEYKILEGLKNVNYKTVEEKKIYVYKVRKYINELRASVDKNQYIELLSAKLDLPELDIRHILSKGMVEDSYAQEDYDEPRIACQKYIIASFFSKFGYLDTYKILKQLKAENVLDKEFLNIYNTIIKTVLTKSSEGDIINILQYSGLDSDERNILNDCYFKRDEFDYLDYKLDKDNNDNLYDLRKFIEAQIGDLK